MAKTSLIFDIGFNLPKYPFNNFLSKILDSKVKHSTGENLSDSWTETLFTIWTCSSVWQSILGNTSAENISTTWGQFWLSDILTESKAVSQLTAILPKASCKIGFTLLVSIGIDKTISWHTVKEYNREDNRPVVVKAKVKLFLRVGWKKIGVCILQPLTSFIYGLYMLLLCSVLSSSAINVMVYL